MSLPFKSSQLTSSMRLFPHDQDTGGFFVCVLEKTKTAPAEPVPAPAPIDEKPVIDDAVVADEAGSSTLKRELSPSAAEGPEDVKKVKKELKKEEKKKRRDPSWKEDPFSYVDPDHQEVKAITYVPDVLNCQRV